MLAHSPIKKILRNASVLLTGNLSSSALTFLSIAVLAKSVGVEEFGFYILLFSFAEIMNKLLNLQTWQAFIKYSADYGLANREKILSLLKFCTAIDFLSLCLGFLVTLVFSRFFLDFFSIPEDVEGVLVVFALSLLFSLSSILVGVFRIFDLFWVQSKILMISSLLKLLLFLMISYVQPNLLNFSLAILFVQIFTTSITIFLAVKSLNERGFTVHDAINVKINFLEFKERGVFQFVIYNNLDSAVRMVSRQLDVLLIGRFFGAELVGLYKIAKELSNVIAKLIDPIYQAIYPELSKLLSCGKGLEARQVALRISLYVGAAGAIFYIMFYALGGWVTTLIFGPDFIRAYEIALVYFIGVYIAMISLPLVPLLLSKGHVRAAFMNQLFSTVIYLVIIIPLIQIFPTYGAALAYIGFYIVWVTSSAFTISKKRVFV